MTGQHAPTSASTLYRRWICPGSVHAEEGLPDEPSEAAERGTRIHAAVANPDLVEDLDEEERDIALAQLETIKPTLDTCDKYGFETHFVLKSTKGKELFGGTIDFFAITGDEVIVRDLKTGRGALNLKAASFQGTFYLACLLQYFPNLNKGTCYFDKSELGETHSVTLERKYLGAVIDQCEGIFYRQKQPGSHLNADPVACQWCKARTTCPEIRRQARDLVTVASKGSDLVNKDFLYLYEMNKTVKSYSKAVDAEARKRAERGDLPGYCLKERAGRRRFTDGAKAAHALILKGLSARDIDACTSLGTSRLEERWLETQRERYPTKKACLEALWNEISEWVERTPPSMVIAKESRS